MRLRARLAPPEGRRNPGVPDGGVALRRRGIQWQARSADCRALVVEPPPHGEPLAARLEKARAGLARFFRGLSLPGESAGLLSALVTGEREALSPEFQDSFRRAGLSHLLAISGLHLGLVAVGAYLLLCRLLARSAFFRWQGDVRRPAALAAFLLALGYTMLSGSEVPAVMAALFMLAVLLGRQRDWLQVLCAAALAILALWPQALWTASFQLSFAAVAGVILAAPIFYGWLGFGPGCREASGWHRPLSWAAQLLSVSLGASLFTAPLVARHFSQVALLGPLVNLVAVPLAAWLVVPLGLLAVVSYPFSQALASAFCWCAAWPALILEKLAGWVADMPAASLMVPTPGAVATLASLVALMLMFSAGRRRLTSGALLLAVAVAWQGAVWLSPRFSGRMEVTFIDVGQGDAALVRLPGGMTLLIDGGPRGPGEYDAGRQVVGRFLLAQGISRLDAVAATHLEADHAGGLVWLVENFHPRELWVGEPVEGGRLAADLAGAAARAGCQIRLLGAGERLEPAAGVALEVLWPGRELAGLLANERSLVLRVAYGERAFLFTGDVEREGERLLLESGAVLRADVVKVGHHGSRGASSPELVGRAHAGVAVISVGRDNVHRLPDAEVEERWLSAGARLLRTDVCGAVSVSTDGRDLEVETAACQP